MLKSAASIKKHADAKAKTAHKEAFAILAPEDGKGAVYQEIRQVCREMASKGDDTWPAKLSQMVREDLNVARALREGTALTVGVSTERHKDLVTTALEIHAPEALATMNHNVSLSVETELMHEGLTKLKSAMFNSAQADIATGTRVDMNAPLIPPEAAE